MASDEVTRVLLTEEHLMRDEDEIVHYQQIYDDALLSKELNQHNIENSDSSSSSLDNYCVS